MSDPCSTKFPQIRHVEPVPVEIEGQQMFYVRDPLEIASSPLGLSAAHLYLLQHFDGKHSVEDIEERFEEAAGGPPPPGLVNELIDLLEERYYLEGPRFRAHFEKLQKEFAESGVRKAWHAGGSYPEDADALREQLDCFYEEAAPETSDLPGDVTAILAPHIDLRVGGACYTHAFDHLKDHDADVFVILGVDHYGEGIPLNACAMDYETPLGRTETDRELLNAWQAKTSEDLTRHQWSHRTEHSIEFPLIFLQHALNRPFKMLPILCGPIEPHLETGVQPGRELLEGLQESLAELGKKAVYILSVDLAHMGPKFGHSFEIDSQILEDIEQADRAMLDCVADWNAPGFFESLEADRNHRNVDAPMAVLSWMALDEARGGRLLDYGQDFQSETKSMVSYASMVFWK